MAFSCSVNCLLVVGHEKLHMEMQRMFGGSQSRIVVIKLPKSGGVRPSFYTA